jgi:hypothetical protein
MTVTPDRNDSDLERITAGTRRQYAEQSLLWTEPSTRFQDEYLQRIWNLANDVIVLEEALSTALNDLKSANDALDIQRRRLEDIVEIATGPTDRFEK